MSKDNLLGTRAQVDKLKAQLAEKDEQLNQVLASREMLIRQSTMIEASALHQHEQNTLLREMLARVVEIFGYDDEAGTRQIVITRERSKEIDKKYGLEGDQALELVIDTDERGMVMRVRERLRVVADASDDGPVEVVLGAGGEVVQIHPDQVTIEDAVREAEQDAGL